MSANLGHRCHVQSSNTQFVVKRLLLLGLVLGMSLGGRASAATITWDAGSTTDLNWSTGSNWDTDTVPDATSDVVLPVPVPNPGSLGTPSVLTLGAGSLANSLTANIDYTLGGGDLTLTTGNVTLNNSASLTIGSTLIGAASTLNLGGNGILTLTGTNTYGGLTTVSGGTLRLNAATGPAIAGNVTLSGGNLSLMAAGQLATTSTVTINSAASTWSLNGFSHTVSSVTIGGAATGGTISTGAGTLTTTNLSLQGNANLNGNITVTGASGLTVANNVNNRLGVGGVLSVQNVTINNSGTTSTFLQLAPDATNPAKVIIGGNISTATSNNIAVIGTPQAELVAGVLPGVIDLGSASHTVTVTRSAGTATNDLVFQSKLVGSGTITKAGAGYLGLGANTTNSTVNGLLNSSTTFSGNWNLTAGRIYINASGAAGSGSINVASGAFLFIANNGNLTGLTAVNVASGGNIYGAVGGAFNGGTINLAGGSSLEARSDTNNNTFGGNIFITGGGSVGLRAGRNNASGTSMSHTIGTITVDGSTLNIDRGTNITSPSTGTLITGAMTLTGSPTFNVSKSGTGFNRFTPGAISEAAGGPYGITKTGDGELLLQNANTYAGATNVNAGFVIVTNPDGLGTTAAGTIVNSGGALDVRTALNSEAISITGTGVSSGGALITGTGSTGSVGGVVTLAGNASVGGAGSLTLLNPVAESAAGLTLTKVGAGNLTLTGTQLYSGLTTVGAGKLGGSATLPAGLSVAGAATVNPGAIGGAGLMTVTGNAQFATTSNLELNLGAVGAGTTSDLLQVNGNLTLDAGTTNVVIAPMAGFGAGTYKLLGYTGVLTNAGNTLSTNTSSWGNGRTYTLDTATAGEINLVVSPAVNFNWADTTAAATYNLAANWAGGVIPDGQAAVVNFGSAIAAPATVTLDTATTFTAGKIVFDNATNGYTIASGTPATASLTMNNQGNGGEIQVVSGTHVISAPVVLVESTTARVDGAQLTLSGVISGAGKLIKEGTGKLVLGGVNTLTGGITLKNGITEYSVAGNMGGAGAGPVTFDGGTLSYTPTATTMTWVTTVPIVAGAGGGTINQAGTGVSTANKITIGANVLSGAGTLTRTGGGVIQFTVAQTGFTGTMAVNGGVLEGAALFPNATAFNVQAGELVLASGATTNTPIIISGGTISSNNGSGGIFAGAITANGNFAVGLRDFQSTANGRSISITGIVGGTGNMTVNAPNTQTLTLGGNNAAWDGLLTINNAAVVKLNNANALGTITGGTVVASTTTGGALDLNGLAITTLEPLSLAGGTGTVATGALRNSSATAASFAGPITLTANSTINTTGDITLTGGITGNFLLTKEGAGTLFQNGANTSTAGFKVSGGTVKVGSLTALGSGLLTVSGPTAVADLNGFATVTMAGLAGTDAAAIVTNNGAADAELVLNAASGTQSYAGIIQNGLTNKISLTINSAGTQVLAGANTYTGVTNVNSGTLQINSAGAIGGSPAVNVANGARVDVNFNNANLSKVNLAVGGTLRFSSTMDTTAGATLPNVNPVVGNIEVNNLAVGPNYNGLKMAGGSSFTGVLANAVWASNLELYSGTVNVGSNNAIVLSGAVTGAGSLNKTGTGTVVLSGPVSYSGPTTVSTGILSLSNVSAGPNNNTIGGNFTVSSGAVLRVSTMINGTGSDPLNGKAITLDGGNLQIQASVLAAPGDAVAGLDSKWFNLGSTPTLMSQINFTAIPTATRIDGQVNYPVGAGTFNTGRPAGVNGTNIAATWNGLINITSPGLYTFASESDDGSHLFIDGTMVINNDGGHGSPGPSPTGTIALTSGLHTLTERYFNGSGNGGIILYYTGPDTASVKTIIPAGVLSSGTLSGVTFGNAITVNPGTTSTIEGAGVDTTMSGILTLGANSTVTLSNVNALTLTVPLNLAGNATLGANNTTGLTLDAGVTDSGANRSFTRTGSALVIYKGTVAAGGGITLSGGTNSFESATTITTGPLSLTAGVNTFKAGSTLTAASVSITGGTNSFSSNVTTTGTAVSGGTNSIGSIFDGGSLSITGGATTVASGGAINASTLSLTHTGGTVLTLNAGAAGTQGKLNLSGDITFLAGSSTATGATQILTGTVGGGQVAGTIDLGGVVRTFNIENNTSATVDFKTTAIIANGGILKDGPGTMAIDSQAPTITGGITVKQGMLQFQANTPNTVPSSNVLTVMNGGTFNLNTATSFTFSNLSDGGSPGGLITSTNGSATIVLSINQMVDGVFAGYITELNAGKFGFTKNGLASLTLGGGATDTTANTYTNTTTVSDGLLILNKADDTLVIPSGTLTQTGGTIRLAANNQIKSTANLTLNATGAGMVGTLDLNGKNQSLGNVTLGGTTTTSQSVITTGAGTLTLGGTLTYTSTNNPLGSTITGNLDLGAASRTFAIGDSTTAAPDLTISANIASAAGAFGFTKTNAGILALTGTNTYSGETILTAGTLRANNGQGLPAGSLLTLSGGTFESNGTSVVNRTLGANPGDIRFTAATNLSASGGPATFTFNGGAGLTWGQTDFISTAMALQLSSTTADNTVTITNAIDLAGAARTVTVNDNAASTTDLAVLSGGMSNGSLVKNGAGTLLLGNATWAQSSTTVATGVLTTATGVTLPKDVFVASNSGGTGHTGTMTMAAGGTLTIGSGPGSNLHVARRITDNNTGTITGTLDLSAGATFTANVDRFTASTDAFSNNGFLFSTIKLAATSNITAATGVTLGDSPTEGTVSGSMTLGTTSTTITTPSMLIGGRKSSFAVTLPAGATFTLNNGAGLTNLSICANTVGTGTTPISSLDVSAGTFIASLDVLEVAKKTSGGGGTATASLLIGPSPASAVTANSVIIAYLNNTSASTGTLSIGGGTFTVGAGGITDGGGTSTLNLSGGVLNLQGNNVGNVDNLSFTGGTLRDVGTLARDLTQTGATSLLEVTAAHPAGMTINGIYSLDQGAASIASGKTLTATGAVALLSGSINGPGSISGTLYDLRAGSVSAVMTGAASLSKFGPGTVTVSSNNTYTGTTDVTQGTLIVSGSVATSSGVTLAGVGSKLVAASSQTMQSLTIADGTTVEVGLVDNATGYKVLTLNSLTLTAATGKIQLHHGGLIVDYTGTAPDVRQMITNGLGTGVWDGTGGITSSVAAADPLNRAVGYVEASDYPALPASFMGSAVLDNTTLLVRLTVKGDATLDGLVNFDDLVQVAQNYESGTGKTWYLGDFNYDGSVTFDDLVDVAQHYETALPGDLALAIPGASANFAADWALAQQAAVPEPGVISLLAAGSLLLLRRNRRAA